MSRTLTPHRVQPYLALVSPSYTSRTPTFLPLWLYHMIITVSVGLFFGMSDQFFLSNANLQVRTYVVVLRWCA